MLIYLWAGHQEFEIDITKPGLEKVHTEIELKRTDAKDEHETLIFIVRNPKEVFVRHMGKKNLMDAMAKQPTPEPFQIYFDALKIFDEWRSPRKILIYYEDFMQHPKETLSSLLDFLHEPADLLPEFMDSYEMHKKKVYKFTETLNPKEMMFYSILNH